MFDELDAEVSRFLSSPSIAPKGQGSKYVVSPDSQSAWREQLQGKTQPNAIAQYSKSQEKIQKTLLQKSLGRGSPDKYAVPAKEQRPEKSKMMIKEKRNRRREEFQSTLKQAATSGTVIPKRGTIDRSLNVAEPIENKAGLGLASNNSTSLSVEESSHFRVNRALRSQIAANRKQYNEMKRLLAHLDAERERLNSDKEDLSLRLEKLIRQRSLNEQRTEVRETRPESHKIKDKVQEALETELSLLEAGAEKLENQIDIVTDVLEGMDRAINAAKQMIQDKKVAMELDGTVLSTLNARTDHLSVGCGRTSAGFKKKTDNLKAPKLLTKEMPEIVPLLQIKKESVETGEGNTQSTDQKSVSPESQIASSPKANKSLLPVDSWTTAFERLSKRCKELVNKACHTRVNIKAICQSLGDFCSNADLQKAQKDVSFQFRECLRTEKLIIENVEAELKDMKIIRRAEKAEVRVARVLKEKLASITVFEERITVRLANRPPGETTNDRASIEIKNAILEMREEARDLEEELNRIQADLKHLQQQKQDTEEHIKDKRVAVKIDTKAFLLGEKKKKKKKPEKSQGKEEASDDPTKSSPKKGKKKRNIWTFYY
jgi:hypothetical protein